MFSFFTSVLRRDVYVLYLVDKAKYVPVSQDLFQGRNGFTIVFPSKRLVASNVNGEWRRETPFEKGNLVWSASRNLRQHFPKRARLVEDNSGQILKHIFKSVVRKNSKCKGIM